MVKLKTINENADMHKTKTQKKILFVWEKIIFRLKFNKTFLNQTNLIFYVCVGGDSIRILKVYCGCIVIYIYVSS